MAYISFQPSDYFNTKLYTGNGSTQSISSVGFQPDWVWIKNRDGTNNHILQDAVRGATKSLESDGTGAETTSSTRVTSFDSDGFSIGSAGTNNTNTNDYVSWNWLANGSGSANTDGTISSTVSANTTSGFSIVKYTNPSSGSPFTVGHGLGSELKCVITKNLSASQTWGVWHTGIGFGNYIRLDSTAASAAANLVTATSSTTFSSYYDHHTAGNEIIAYCFAEKKGFSKFGSYTGNGNADGSFIYTGFKPAFVITKMTSSTGWWSLHDFKREGYNGANDALYPNTSDAEGSGYIDILSNGFKIKSTNANINSSGGTYIFMAFASEPLVSSNDIPATAR